MALQQMMQAPQGLKPQLYTAYTTIHVNNIQEKRRNREMFFSESFFCDLDPLDTAWYLGVRFGCVHTGWLTVSIHHRMKRDIQVKSFTIAMFDGNEIEIRRARMLQPKVVTPRQGTGFPQFYKLDVLPVTTKLVGNQQAQISFDVRISYKGLGAHMTLGRVPKVDPQLSDHYLEILESGKGSDLVFHVKGEKFPVNKAILGSRSEYFKNLFKEGTAESTESEITLKDVEPDIFRLLLEYLYGGKLPRNLDKVVYDVLPLADKYGILGLRQACETQWIRMLSVENVCGCAAYAYRLDCPELKAAAIRFIKANSEEVKRTQGWKDMKSCPGLAEEFLDFL